MTNELNRIDIPSAALCHLLFFHFCFLPNLRVIFIRVSTEYRRSCICSFPLFWLPWQCSFSRGILASLTPWLRIVIGTRLYLFSFRMNSFPSVLFTFTRRERGRERKRSVNSISRHCHHDLSGRKKSSYIGKVYEKKREDRPHNATNDSLFHLFIVLPCSSLSSFFFCFL